uniref:Uncharacterized protein n=1 Tax=Rhizophora mucronata TaxID=61149 RepID=A0A2P2PZ01_RHIMU
MVCVVWMSLLACERSSDWSNGELVLIPFCHLSPSTVSWHFHNIGNI